MHFLGYDLSATQDLLNMTLTIGFALIAIVLVLVLLRIFRILGKVDRIAERVSEIADLVTHYLWQPARMMLKILEKVKGFWGGRKKTGK